MMRRPPAGLAALAVCATMSACAPAPSARPTVTLPPVTVTVAAPAAPAPGGSPVGGPAATASASRPSLTAAPGFEAEGSRTIADLSLANVGKTAGTCAATPTRNSLGGTAFEHSCVGWNDVPEYWCADFVIWAWRHSGYDVEGLDAASISFARYGRKHGSLRERPKPGDAIVMNKTMSTTSASHVAVVTNVLPDGSVELANGDWAGEKGRGEAQFAKTASVVRTVIPGEGAVVGGPALDAQGGLRVIAIVAPVKKG